MALTVHTEFILYPLQTDFDLVNDFCVVLFPPLKTTFSTTFLRSVTSSAVGSTSTKQSCRQEDS